MVFCFDDIISCAMKSLDDSSCFLRKGKKKEKYVGLFYFVVEKDKDYIITVAAYL